VKNIRPKYENLKDWINDPNNIYIARKGVIFIEGKRFPPFSSPFANPFKISELESREEVIVKYKEYISKKLENNTELQTELIAMKGKNLGCWCFPEKCHGDVVLEMIYFYCNKCNVKI
jgi:hypothetical protein